MKTLFLLIESEDLGRSLITFIVGFVIIIVLFLALRALMLWYWKVNILIENQEEQIRLLKKIAGEKEIISKEKKETKSDLSFIETEHLPPERFKY